MSIWQKFFTPNSSRNPKRMGKFHALFVMLALLAGAFFLSLYFGSASIRFWDALGELLRGEAVSSDSRILLYLRLPRALGAVLAGSALAVAGVLIQAVLQNPMAAPNIIGVNSGAGLGAVLLLALFPSAIAYLPLAAFLGAILACLCIYFISASMGARRTTVILVGIAVGAILNAGINTVKTLFPDSIYDAETFMVGGLSGVTLARLWPAAVCIGIGFVLSLLFARDADILSLGGDTAGSLGMNVKGTRFLFLILASMLAGAAVSFAGLLGFVGLVVPHICRYFVGQNHRWLIPVSALGGAVLVLLCDLLCRILFVPYEIPVGILLSFVGGPFFLILLLRRKDHA